mgnify:CR=1 FL=1
MSGPSAGGAGCPSGALEEMTTTLSEALQTGASLEREQLENGSLSVSAKFDGFIVALNCKAGKYEAFVHVSEPGAFTVRAWGPDPGSALDGLRRELAGLLAGFARSLPELASCVEEEAARSGYRAATVAAAGVLGYLTDLHDVLKRLSRTLGVFSESLGLVHPWGLKYERELEAAGRELRRASARLRDLARERWLCDQSLVF